ncbi:hypothetical protein [Mobilicoccus caccae]|uniref:Uncharacterized protein n=1 Tax=Mobilicoccus caccae TaxID=1859295 RepID=A0ABQ6IQA1_9MICO|nr:hypothetical protein [Mobilicoccus caccae]GMA38894.1 hypothetical protein GCM10025883_09390 [Mobilicoccus caccae]
MPAFARVVHRHSGLVQGLDRYVVQGGQGGADARRDAGAGGQEREIDDASVQVGVDHRPAAVAESSDADRRGDVERQVARDLLQKGDRGVLQRRRHRISRQPHHPGPFTVVDDEPHVELLPDALGDHVDADRQQTGHGAVGEGSEMVGVIFTPPR